MISVLIIEDEFPAAEKLKNMLLQYDENIQVLGLLGSVTEALDYLRYNKSPDLILSDIHLSDGLSFEIFRQVEVACPIIFCTAYDEYALQAFEVNSIDYLLKPVQYARLERSLNKLRAFSASRKPTIDQHLVTDLLSRISGKENAYKSRFMVKIGNRIKAVKTDDIAYFHSQNKLTLLVTKEGNAYPVDYSLDDLIAMLNPDVFFHVNRNLIIHIDAAREIHPYFKGRMKLVLNPALEEEVIVSSQRTPLFKIWLDK